MTFSSWLVCSGSLWKLIKLVLFLVKVFHEGLRSWYINQKKILLNNCQELVKPGLTESSHIGDNPRVFELNCRDDINLRSTFIIYGLLKLLNNGELDIKFKKPKKWQPHWLQCVTFTKIFYCGILYFLNYLIWLQLRI